MLRENYTIGIKEYLYLIPVGDIHLGSESANLDYLYYWQDLIKRIRSPKRIYLMGDLVESATKRLSNSAYRQEMNVNDQIEVIVDFFEPFKEDIVFSAVGNHEIRLSKEFDLDITRLMAKQLGCPSGHQYLDTFSINEKPTTVYIAHGKGSSMYHYTAESKIIRDTQSIQSDIFLHGHNHRCGHFSIPNRTAEGMKRKHYCFTGAFLSYDGYADSMHLPILPEGFMHLRMDRDSRINPTLFYIDERLPEAMDIP